MLRFIRFISKDTKNSLRTGESIKQNLHHQEQLHAKSLPYWTKRDKSHRQKYGQWNPTRKLNRQRIQDLKNLADMMPHLRTVDLATMFNVSPEAIRRILKSNWLPNDLDEDKLVKRMERKRQQIAQDKLQVKTQKKLEINQLAKKTSPVKILNFGQGNPATNTNKPNKLKRTNQKQSRTSQHRHKHRHKHQPKLDLSDIID